MNPFKKHPVISCLVGCAIGTFAVVYTLENIIDVKARIRRAMLRPQKYGTVENPDYLIRATFEVDSNASSWIVTPEFKNWRRMENIREFVQEREQKFASIRSVLKND